MARYDEGFLRAALIGYESEKAKIQAAITAIQAQLDHRGPGRPKAAVDGEGHSAPKRRTMSASARRRIAAAQRKRWALVKAKQGAHKRTISAEARKKIAAAQRKRWAAAKKAQAKKTSRKATAAKATPAKRTPSSEKKVKTAGTAA